MGSGISVRIPHRTFKLDPGDVEILVDELEKLENDRAASVVSRLQLADLYEPSREDIVELARALDHLRNIGRLTGRGEASALRDALVASFEPRTYRLIPQSGDEPFDSFGYGPVHTRGSRLVDFATGREWRVIEARPESEPLALVVERWRPASQAGGRGHDQRTA